MLFGPPGAGRRSCPDHTSAGSFPFTGPSKATGDDAQTGPTGIADADREPVGQRQPYREVVRIDPDTDRSFVDKLAQKSMGQATFPWDPAGTDRFVVVVEPRRTVPHS